MKECLSRLYNGIIKENPTFVLMLGMCPTLAVTTSAINGLGMGLSTMVVLALSNMMISALRKIIPEKVRIPAYIVIIATFVTVVGLLMNAYLPSLYASLGIYIDLIVVNCIILGRAESYASKNKVIPSFFDGVGMGLGFTLSLTIIGFVRELFGAGKIFGYSIESLFGFTFTESVAPIGILVMAPGAFFVLALLCVTRNYVIMLGKKNNKDVSTFKNTCGMDCATCGQSDCNERRVSEKSKEEEVESNE